MRNLSKTESDALRDIALQCGYSARRGPLVKDGQESGNVIDLLLAIISGQVAPVLLSGDVQAALPWLVEVRGQCPDETSQRGIDQLIAALWVANNKQKGYTMSTKTPALLFIDVRGNTSAPVLDAFPYGPDQAPYGEEAVSGAVEVDTVHTCIDLAGASGPSDEQRQFLDSHSSVIQWFTRPLAPSA